MTYENEKISYNEGSQMTHSSRHTLKEKKEGFLIKLMLKTKFFHTTKQANFFLIILATVFFLYSFYLFSHLNDKPETMTPAQARAKMHPSAK